MASSARPPSSAGRSQRSGLTLRGVSNRTPVTKPSTHRIKGWDRACGEDLVEVVVDGVGVELHGRREKLVTRTRAHRRTGGMTHGEHRS